VSPVSGSTYVYTINFYSINIQQFDTNGNLLATWASGCPLVGIAVDYSGNVYANDQCNNIMKFDNAGKLLTSWTIPNSGYYGGMAIDNQGNIYIEDVSNGGVDKYSSTGTLLTSFGNFYPYGVAVDSSGNVVYATELNNNVVDKFTR
jgi:DNA-binding beta-propeller fold protein YncE